MEDKAKGDKSFHFNDEVDDKPCERMAQTDVRKVVEIDEQSL